MEVQSKADWAERLGSTARYTLIVVAAIFGLFALGMVAGFSYAVIEDGRMPTKPLVYLIFAAMVGLVAIIGWVLTNLIRSIRPQSMSGFDRRYWKMWTVILVLSMPFGIGLAVFGIQEGGFPLVLSNSPIAPLTAISVAVSFTALLALSAVYYHRTVDDHEERAYLWGTTMAYYFLLFAFPLYWLLARGGIVPALTIGFALLLVLLSCVLQAIVWAVFKFR